MSVKHFNERCVMRNARATFGGKKKYILASNKGSIHQRAAPLSVNHRLLLCTRDTVREDIIVIREMTCVSRSSSRKQHKSFLGLVLQADIMLLLLVSRQGNDHLSNRF